MKRCISYDSSEIECLIEANISSFLSKGNRRVIDISLNDISRQNSHSSRLGGKCTIKYIDVDGEVNEIFVWLKLVEQPELFHQELRHVI